MVTIELKDGTMQIARMFDFFVKRNFEDLTQTTKAEVLAYISSLTHLPV